MNYADGLETRVASQEGEIQALKEKVNELEHERDTFQKMLEDQTRHVLILSTIFLEAQDYLEKNLIGPTSE